MGRIVLHHGSGDQGFEIHGSPSAVQDRATLFNARRVLVARGHLDPVQLLDRFPFKIYPASNHFNDDFEVLHADVPLAEYEALRPTEREKRQLGRQIAEAIGEVASVYIRFVSIGLLVADPEDREVFLCHASEDKADVARPMCRHLESCGIQCWFDEAEIAWGESIVGKIQDGLTRAQFVIVILSSHFLRKQWTQKELRSALSLEIETGRATVLPLLVGDADELLSELPFLREKRYLRWTGDPSLIERELRVLLRRKDRGGA
jgi:hypothetical protein